MVLSFLNSLGPAVGNHLWQSTVFVAVVWVVALVLRRNSARVRYGLWLVGSVKFLMPFSLLIGLGGLLPRPSRVVVAAPVYSAVDSVGLPFSEMNFPVDTSAETHVSGARHGAPSWLPVVIAGVWVCGVAGVLMVWLVRWWRVAAAVRRARRVESGREFEILRRVDVRGEVGLRMSRELMEPGVFGVWRPVLLWPEQLSLRLQDEHIAAIVAHEFMHVRRRDNLAAMLHMVVEGVFWFHPMVWWMERRMVEERERACDEAVVELGAEAGVYAESLLKAVRFCVESPLTCVAGITGADLSRRVRSIMTLRLESLSLGRKVALGLLGLAMVLGPVGFGVVRMIPVYGQVLRATGPLPSFEVATIRLSRDAAQGADTEGEQTHYQVTAKMLIQFAYALPTNNGRGIELKVEGGPDWIDTDVYDIVAKASHETFAAMDKMTRAQKREQRSLMEQSLLADRMKLKVHVETRDEPVYALTVIKGGPKMKPAADVTGGATVKFNASADEVAQLHRGLLVRAKGSGFEMTVKGMTLAAFVDALQSQKEARGLPVVDQTGLTGAYDFTLNWGPELTAAPDNGDAGDSSAPPLLAAIQEQLGLKLGTAKGPAEVLVVDHIERPVAQDEAGFVKAAPSAAPSPKVTAMASQPMLRPVALAQTIPAQRAVEVPSGPLPSFEVASVKPVGPNSSDGVGLFTYPGGRIICSRCPLQYLLMEAFDVQTFQVSGPDWIKDAAFDVEAKPPASSAATKLNDPSIKTPPNQEQREMLQSLLMQRFGLKFHRGTKDGDVYVLEKGDKPLKLKAPKDDHAFSWAGGVEGGGVYDGAGMAGTNISMAQLATRLGGFLHRTVLDQTGISSAYDFEFRTGNADADADVTAAIFASMQGIGLKLKAAKGPVETIVVDHVERPSAN